MSAEAHSTGMYEVLDETTEDLIVIRVGRGTRQGYADLYSMLAERTETYGSLRVCEEVTGWTLGAYLSHLHGVVPDLRSGATFDISRYAAVGDSVWARLLFEQWRAIRPVWPVAPDEMRYFELPNRDGALQWLDEPTVPR